MGVYEQVKNNYDKITPKKKKTTVKEKDSTVDNIISQLNEKQKKELLKKLEEKLK